MWTIFKGIIPAADGEDTTGEGDENKNISSPYPQLTAEEVLLKLLFHSIHLIINNYNRYDREELQIFLLRLYQIQLQIP
jgi:hypothetical protein